MEVIDPRKWIEERIEYGKSPNTVSARRNKSANQLILPILHSDHWTMAIIDLEANLAYHLDPSTNTASKVVTHRVKQDWQVIKLYCERSLDDIDLKL
ncbi:hypothetical protein NW762_013412, partial [Fusarium torreyae]